MIDLETLDRVERRAVPFVHVHLQPRRQVVYLWQAAFGPAGDPSTGRIPGVLYGRLSAPTMLYETQQAAMDDLAGAVRKVRNELTVPDAEILSTHPSRRGVR